VLLDVRMPGMNGIAVFDQLVARGLLPRLPVIFLTGHGDVPMAVDSLKRGAFDFFEKPFNDNQLMDRVDEARAQSRRAADSAAVRSRLATLSAREREVLDLILAGKMNKVVADELGISMRTVEVHRAHIFDKMQVKTAVELAGLLKYPYSTPAHDSLPDGLAFLHIAPNCSRSNGRLWLQGRTGPPRSTTNRCLGWLRGRETLPTLPEVGRSPVRGAAGGSAACGTTSPSGLGTLRRPRGRLATNLYLLLVTAACAQQPPPAFLFEEAL